MVIVISTYLAFIISVCIIILFGFMVFMYYQLKSIKDELKHHSDAISDIYTERKYTK
jgi:hypothetical protein